MSEQLNNYNVDTSELMNSIITDVSDLHDKSGLTSGYINEILKINNDLLEQFTINKSILMQSSAMSEKSISNFNFLDGEVKKVDDQISIMHKNVKLIKDHFELTGITCKKQSMSMGKISDNVEQMNNFIKTVVSSEKSNRTTLESLNLQIRKFRNNPDSH